MALAITLAAVSAGCAQEEVTTPEPTATEESPQAEASKVTFKLREFAFDVPKSFKGGLVEILMDNSAGKESHEAEMTLLSDGKTVKDLQEHYKNTEAPPEWAKPYGGSGPVLAGKQATYTANLPEGTYALVCHVPSPSDGTAHLEKGMVSEVKVEKGEDGELPESDLTIDGAEKEENGKTTFSFDGIEDLKAGEQTVKMTVTSKQPHFFALTELQEGKTPEDVLKFFSSEGPPSGPPPFGNFPGLAATMLPGQESTRTLDLEPGTYVMFCLIPDTDGTPHAAKGMLQKIEIKEA
ncbi:MAG: hypothetical protein ACRDIU_07895 [Actinomycetota bacterium]